MWRKDMSTMDAINSNEDKYMIKVSEDDAINAKFNTKLQELLDIAHSKKNVIEDTELIKHFNDLKEVALDLDTMQKIFNFIADIEILGKILLFLLTCHLIASALQTFLARQRPVLIRIQKPFV